MANLYHINGDSVSPCKAVKGQCPFGQGEENNHFSDAGEAMVVLEYRLEKEYGAGTGQSVSKAVKSTTETCNECGVTTTGPNGMVHLSSCSKHASKAAKEKTAAELAAEGADTKVVRDALRKENPTWGTRQVHMVEKRMTDKAKAVPAAPTKLTNAKQSYTYLDKRHKAATVALKEASDAQKRHAQAVRTYDETRGIEEGRAYYYGGAEGKTFLKPGEKAPYSRNVFYTPMETQTAEKTRLAGEVEKARLAQEQTQTELEQAGFGHKMPDMGNTIRVNTQAQKWLLENNLKGQISDGRWENSGPQDHWKDWSNATVIVDPQNVGRNFSPRKDNYQLNSANLLSIIGGEMVAGVKEKTGQDYDEREMARDLQDLRKIFKTARNNHAG